MLTRTQATYTAASPPEDAARILYPHSLLSLTPETSYKQALTRIGTTFSEEALDGASRYVVPKSLIYDFDGKPRRWDVVESHQSVGIILYDTQRDAFLIVRQFRPAVYAAAARESRAHGSKQDPPLAAGFTFELCAGLIDKAGKTVEDIVREEVLEECGYNLPASPPPLFVSSAVASSGVQGSQHAMFYAEVDDSMRVHGEGGGLAHTGECIEVLALPYQNTEAFVVDPLLPKSPGLMFGLLWAYHGLASGRLGGRQALLARQRKAVAGNGGAASLLTEELTLKPVLPS